MGICSSQKQTKQAQNKMQQPKIIIPSQNRPDESQKVQFEEGKTAKQPQNQNSRQHSPHNSHHSLRSLEQVADAEQRCSIVSQPFKKNERPSKLQSSRISKVNSSRSLQCPGSPMSVRGSILQCVQFFSTNASKKYSIITKKERQLNPELTFVENNKTGKRARLEVLEKADEDSIKYIYWLKSNQLEHKSILKCLEVHQDNEAYQIIYESFDGFNLSHLSSQEDLTEQTLANVADQMLSALNYLKTLSIVHGNLTIDSWQYRFISGQIVVKLINVQPISAKKEIDINMAYLIAPEQIYKDEYNSERDLWAVMMTIFILAKGQPPYKIPNNTLNDLPGIKQIILHHKFYQEVDIPKFSLVLKNFLKNVIFEKPKFRKQLSEIMQHEWLINNRYPDISIQERLLMNILNQKGICMLQQAILEIMIQEFEQETAIQLQKMVSEFDSDMDTQLTKEEFIQLFQKYTKVTDLEDKINVVYNENGIKDDLIPQFTFLALAAPRDQLINRFNLEIVFNLLSNNKPEIRASNITKYLNVQNEELEAQFNELAPEKKLNLNQFIKMMELVK